MSRPAAPLRAIGSLQRGPGARWSRKRKFRLARTGVILLTLILVFTWLTKSCGDDSEVATDDSTTTTAAPTTTAPPNLTLAAAQAPKGLPSAHSDAPAVTNGLPGQAGSPILILGGVDKSKSSKTAVWAYDPATGSTTSAGVLKKATHSSAAALVGDAVLLFGGSVGPRPLPDVQRYDPATQKTTIIGQMPTKRSEFGAVVDPEGPMVYLVGGFDGADPTNDILATLDGTTFQKVATLAEPVRHPAVVLSGSTIWVFGGEWDDVSSASIQKIDILTGQTEVFGKMQTPISHAMGFTIEDEIFLAGGRVAGGRSNEVRRFDPETGAFTVVTTLPSNLSDSSVATSGRTAYLFGGLAPTATNKIVTIAAT